MKLAINIKKLKEDAAVPNYETTSAAGFDFRAHTNGESIVLPPAVMTRLQPAKTKLGRFFQNLQYIFIGGKYKAVPSRKLVKTGLAIALPQGFELQVRSRSGLALKQGIQAHVGTIDADYRGEIGIILFNFGSEPFVINHGDRVAQGVINRVEQAGFFEVDELDETERGTGGFGSTGVSTAEIANHAAKQSLETTKFTQGVRL